jgi:hypothetical protein
MGRDHVTEAELALDADHRILGMRVETTANMGAYSSLFGPFIPTGAAIKVLPGVYDVKNLVYRVKGVLTNTTPVDAYRGAGRPESIYLLERLMDAAAREVGEDPVAIRRKNFIPSSAMPFKTAAGEIYDSGDFARVMGFQGGLKRAPRTKSVSGARTGRLVRAYSMRGGDHANLACPHVEVGWHRPGGHRCHRNHLRAVHSRSRCARSHCSYRRGPDDALLDSAAGRRRGGYCRVRDWAASRAYVSRAAHAGRTSSLHTSRSGSRRSGSPWTTKVSPPW